MCTGKAAKQILIAMGGDQPPSKHSQLGEKTLAK
jgi:hypothetical protein